MVSPAILLAQTDMMIQIGIQPGPGHRVAEGCLVQERRARADDHAVDALFADVVLDHGLPGVRAHEHVGAGNHHVW